MPISNKSSKKTNSKELVGIIDKQASTLKSKSNKGLLSSLFSRKAKTKTIEDNKSITCLYTNSHASDASSANISSIKNEVAIGNSNIQIDINDKTSKEKTDKTHKPNKTDVFSQISDIFIDSTLCISDIPITLVLKEVLQFNIRIQDSENHLVQILTKYLKDNTLQKQLIDIVSNHSKLQMQVERRNQAFASVMWKQQSDIYKSQEKVLTENLKEIVWQNRKLQEENELLMRRIDLGNEKDIASNALENDIVERLHQGNERLRAKLSNLAQHLHEMENSLLNERSRCRTLEEQFAVCFSELQTEKTNLQSLKLDHQLEMANTKEELDLKVGSINNALKIGKEILNQIEQIKDVPCVIDLIKNQKNETDPLLSIIFMSKSTIEVLINKLFDMKKDINAVTSEREHYKSESLKLQKTLESTSQEVLGLMKQTELLNEVMKEKEQYLSRIAQIEKERMLLENELSLKVAQLEEVNAEKMFMIEGIHQVKGIVHVRDDELKLAKAENETLVFQNKSLSQILMQSGSGDVARELASSQEKLQTVQAHYYQVICYKDQLEEKLKLCSNEIELLKTTNHNLTEKITMQSNTISELNETKLKLKEEIGNNQATLTALQNERRRHLAEMNFLRTIYDKVEQSVSKTECLEGSLCEVSKEADRLAIIAEFNKQLGERYQAEIQEKDEMIRTLRDLVNKLSIAEQENIKEKLALCEELTQMCSMKEQLTNKLKTELEKNASICESAKETESSVSEELKILKEMQKVERSAVKELLEDFNILVAERDNLLKFKIEAENQLERLQQQVNDYQREYSKNGKDLIEKQHAIEKLDKQLRSSDEKSKYLTTNVENAFRKQISEMEQLVEENAKLLAEKNKYKSSVDYLKSNIHNLQTSLDHSRKNETEYKKLYDVESEKCKKLTDELKERNSSNSSIAEELITLRERFGQLQKEYQNLYSNHEELLKEMPEQVVMDDFKKARRLLEDYQDEIDCLKNKISSQNATIESIEKEKEKLEWENEELAVQTRKLNQNLLDVTSQRDLLNTKLNVAESELERIKLELNELNKLMDEKSQKENYLENSYFNAQTHLQDLVGTLQNADEKIIKLKSKLELAQSMYRTLEETHRKLAEKLLKTVHCLMNEKISRRTAESNYENVNRKMVKIEKEKSDLIQKLKYQNDTIKNQERKFIDIEAIKIELEAKLAESTDNYNDLLSRYDEVIKDFAATEVKCKDYEFKLNNNLCCAKCKRLEDQMNDLKSNLESSHESLASLQDTITTLKLSITTLEFQKSENDIYMHDLEKKLEVERSLREESQNSNDRILTKILELKAESKISSSTCDILLSVVNNSV